ncbi:uncharacterized protein VP01_6721g3 [Puccinia sorghi]|uniref:Reverse transcriptase Ty1/copia-type domain-containing protein n=1 Tax=Puccinia sorghi TaxID=27349 RepID=A0A0L6UES0_9BASI|nr:uncharacterized protein VP01_6721g3 [Puccinia sorghi]
MLRNHEQAIRSKDGDYWVKAVETKLQNIWDRLDGDTVLVWIHVDDSVVMVSSKRVLHCFQNILESKLSVTWEGTLHTIVKIKVEHPLLENVILSQPFLTDKILKKFTSEVTFARVVPIKDINICTSTVDGEEITNLNGYLSIVGSLNYLAVATRPLAFAVGFLACFAKSSTKRHWAAVQHALGYIKAWGCRSLSLSSVDNGMLT